MKVYPDTGLIIHRQVNLGPLVYSDREWLGVRLRCIWILGRKVITWRAR